MQRVHRSFANSRLALTLRRLRGRFGISAPRVAVRTHVPWYWRLLGAAVVLGVAFALAGLIYDAGRRYAGFDRSETQQELTALREKVASLEADVDRQRSLVDSSDSSLQIERTAQQQLTLQVKRLEAENARLKEDVALFESLAQADAGSQPGVSIHRLRVEPDAAGPGQYRYRMLVSLQGAKREREFSGSLQLVVTVQQEGKVAIINYPRPNEADASGFIVNFKHFRRLEGVIRVPDGAVIRRVEARMQQGGATVATQSVAL